MTYIPLIIKSDFQGRNILGANISTDILDVHIRDAQEIDFLSWADDEFYTNVLTMVSTNDTTKPQLNAFLNDYIKPYLINRAYYRFLLWLGRNPSQFGLRQNNEDTSSEVSDKVRGELMQDVQHKANITLSRIKKRLSDLDYTFDNVVYTFYDDGKNKPKPIIQIKQVGRNKRYYGDFNDRNHCCDDTY